LRELGISDLEDVAKGEGIDVRRFPIPDFATPASRAETRALVAWILAEIGASRVVVVCCKGGLGRTGMIAACALARYGASPSVAIDAIRAARPGAIETIEQERFARTFSEAK
jgi:protein-tyrosine phosphatase